MGEPLKNQYEWENHRKGWNNFFLDTGVGRGVSRDQRTLQSGLTRVAPGYIQPKVVVLDTTSPLCSSQSKEWKIGSFQWHCLSKNSEIWLGERRTWSHSKWQFHVTFCSWLATCIINQDINWFFPEKLMIKEYCKLIVKEAWLATLNQKW